MSHLVSFLARANRGEEKKREKKRKKRKKEREKSKNVCFWYWNHV